MIVIARIWSVDQILGRSSIAKIQEDFGVRKSLLASLLFPYGFMKIV